jgi:hypothetical protein
MTTDDRVCGRGVSFGVPALCAIDCRFAVGDLPNFSGRVRFSLVKSAVLAISTRSSARASSVFPPAFMPSPNAPAWRSAADDLEPGVGRPRARRSPTCRPHKFDMLVDRLAIQNAAEGSIDGCSACQRSPYPGVVLRMRERQDLLSIGMTSGIERARPDHRTFSAHIGAGQPPTGSCRSSTAPP